MTMFKQEAEVNHTAAIQQALQGRHRDALHKISLAIEYDPTHAEYHNIRSVRAPLISTESLTYIKGPALYLDVEVKVFEFCHSAVNFRTHSRSLADTPAHSACKHIDERIIKAEFSSSLFALSMISNVYGS